MRLQNKIILITGASRGIGAHVAKRLAREGAHIIIAARTISGLEEVDDYAKAHGSGATIVPVDLLQQDKIDSLGYSVAERFGRLDALVGNAAMLGVLSPIAHYTADHWHNTINLNLNANWRLLRIMDPLLKLSPKGRALFVTDQITRETPAYFGAYTVAKAALEALVKTYAAENENTEIRANLISLPGVATRLRMQAMPGEDQRELVQPEDVTELFVDLLADDCNHNGKVFNLGESNASTK